LPTGQAGRIKWNDTDGTLDVGLKGSNVTLQVGQELVQRVFNNSGSAILNGMPVYLTGAQGNRVTVAKASNTTEPLSSTTFGIATEDIADNSEGFVTTEGLVRDIDTSAFAEGALVYLGATAGSLTTTHPVAPAHAVMIGIVVRSHATVGSIYVKVDAGFELDEIHDILLTAPADGETLTYEAASGLWTNDDAILGKTRMSGFPLDANGNHLVTLSYNETTRTVTITPTGATFDFFVDGVKYTKTGAQSLAHSALAGGHFIYFDNTGTLVTSQTAWNLAQTAPACYVFWDATNSRGVPLNELHTAGRDVFMHQRLHDIDGTQIVDGFAISGYTLLTQTDAAISYAVASGTLADEDLRTTTQARPDAGPYAMMYRSGASGTWEITRTNTVPYLYNGTGVYFNQFTGGVWQLSNLTNNNYVNYFVFAVPALASTAHSASANQSIIIIPGQVQHATLGAANAENVSSLAFGSMPFAEIAPLYQVTVRFNTGYASTPKIRVETVTRVVGTRASITATAQTDHGALSGLTDPDHPASAIINTPAGNIVATDVQAALNELDTEKLSLTGGTMTGDLTLAGDPSSALVAAPRQYVDAVYPGKRTGSATASTATTSVSVASIDTLRISMTANTTLTLSDAQDGQRIVLELIQDGVGGRTLTLDSGFRLGTDITSTTLTTTPSKKDMIGVIYNSTAGKFDVVAMVRGF
jgi:hypothetical protein